MAQVNLDDALAAGRQAARQYAWLEAFQLLGVADQAGRLDADDLETFAETAWWNGHPDQCISARERAYALHLQADRPRRAALVGIALGEFERGASAIGAA